jgi:adenine-specific DNA-methyltransferase
MPPPTSNSEVRLTWARQDQSLVVTDSGERLWVEPHDHRVAEVRLLHSAIEVGKPQENLLIRGDAGHALTSLLRLEELRVNYAGKVRLCYLDPPFNTGETFRHYDDGVERVAWLTMLRDRLLQIRELLAPDGSVWVHLDDSEQHRSRCILDEVFGAGAFVATIVWQKRTSRDNRTAFSSMHDYIHVYSPGGPLAWKKSRNGLPDTGAFSNPDNDPRGPWRSVPMTAQDGHATKAQYYTVTSLAGTRHDPPPGRCWTYSRERFAELVAEGRVYWPRHGHGKPRLKRYASETTGLAPFTIWTADEVGDNASAKKSLLAKFPERAAFDTPKPEALLERIVNVATNPGDLVLDCYLGSGTTAVVAHRLGRRWIGVEANPETVAAFALPRLRMEVAEDRDGTGFAVVDVSPTMFVTDAAGDLGLAPWATGGSLAEATAAQLGYTYDLDGAFAGRHGNSRLAVLDARVDGHVVRMLASRLREDDRLEIAATSFDHTAKQAMADLGPGHRLRLIPEGILATYDRRSVLTDLLGAQATIAIAKPRAHRRPGRRSKSA